MSAVHEKGEPQKGRPIGHKKGIQKDASVLGQIAFEVLRLSKGHLAGNTIFAESALCCGALNMRSASRPFQNGEGLIPVVFNRDDDVHVLLDPLFDPLMGRFPVGPFFLEHFPIGFHEDRGGWDIGGFGKPAQKKPARASDRNRRCADQSSAAAWQGSPRQPHVGMWAAG